MTSCECNPIPCLHRLISTSYPACRAYRDSLKEESMPNIHPSPEAHRIYTEHNYMIRNCDDLWDNAF